MESLIRKFVREAVFSEIRSLARNRGLVISEDDPLIVETPMYGDDFGNIFIIEIEGRFGVRTSTREWSKVCTVGKAIDLLMKSLANG